LLYARYHLFGRHLRPGRKRSVQLVAAGENLDRGPADIHDQHSLDERVARNHSSTPSQCFHALGGEYRSRVHGCSLARIQRADLDLITPIKSLHEFTNDLAPSSCSRADSAWTSIFAAANCARTFSESPPSVGIVAPMVPCSASAFRVRSGIVFTVNGAARALTYRTSEAAGSLVPVLAHSRRCGRAPAL